jgi:hypothetical protein
MTLIQDVPEARGVGEEPKTLQHTERCTVKSSGQKEHYQARALGLMAGV